MSPDSGPRCWAFGPQGRCESFAGHTDDHKIVLEWTDEECINPATYVQAIALPIHDAVLVDQAVPGAPTAVAPCFSCGCSEAAHHEEGDDGEQMCSRHQCREYIP